jgi:hypothetical protein
MEYYTPTFIKKNMDAIKRIRELHTPVTASGCGDHECCSPSDSEEFCSECQNYEYPCNTIKALEGEK